MIRLLVCGYEKRMIFTFVEVTMNHGHDHADHQHHHHQEMITKARMVMNQPAVATTIAAANHGGHSSHLHDMMMSVSIQSIELFEIDHIE